MEALTVTELITVVNAKLKTPTSMSVVGELKEWKNFNGNIYGTLSDGTSSVATVMWKSVVAGLPFEPQVGMEVVVRGRLDVYGKSGKLSFVISSLDPVGVGAQEVARKQLEERLEEKGYFTAESKKLIPGLCSNIAVVTSPDGAVIRDILTTLDRRCGGIAVSIYPAAVQGPRSIPELVAAIAAADAGAHDVILVARGGGSVEDLSSFSSAEVADAIFATRTPLISAVGHETDFSIADKVADLRAPTPTAAAELVSMEAANVRVAVERSRRRLETCRERLNELSTATRVSSRELVGSMRIRLEEAENHVFTAALKLHGAAPSYPVVTRRPDMPGAVLDSASSVRAGEQLTIFFADGAIVVRVEQTENIWQV